MNIFLKRNIGWITVAILAVVPILRWFFVGPLNFRFIDLNATATSLGQIIGLLGMILFSINLILSSRLKIIDKYFDGLPDVYSIHHKIGAISFCLLLAHPLFLVVKFFSFSIKSAVMFFVPQGDAVSFGIYALALMIALMVLTFYIKLKYHIWKFSHKFMVLVFVFAILHNLFITSDISRDLFLRYYIFTFAFVALILGFYQAFLSKIFNRHLEYNVMSVVKLNENVLQIGLEAKDRELKFIPGQFVFIRFLGEGVSSESHPFTISSIPEDGKLEFNIKFLGDFTSQLKNLKEGDRAMISKPYGKFSYKEFKAKEQIWIAGGIGVTPFLSMARSLPKNSSQKIDLYYCIKNEKEIILKNELDLLSQQKSNFNIYYWMSEGKDFITANNILELSSGVISKEIFLCGPVSFMESLRLQFVKLGVKNNNIHWEKFSF
jgi:predicted ferric reductase